MGPMGQGPMTGRGLGWCNTANPAANAFPAGPGFGMRWSGGRGMWPGRGMGWGGGRGGGHGHRNWYYATGLTGWQRAGMGWADSGAAFPPASTGEPELAALRQQASSFEQALSQLRARIQELESLEPAAAPPKGEDEG